MRNIRLEVEYDGTDFYGWEIQPNKRTVRGEIEHRLCEILQERVKLIGAARTDAGVHAICQVANFVTKSNLPISTIRRALLGGSPSICVRNVELVPLEFNSRGDATSRIYLYRVLLGRSPLLRTKVWEYPILGKRTWLGTPILDIEKMECALNIFLGRHRFDLFAHRDTGECEVKRFTMATMKSEFPISLGDAMSNLIELRFEIEATRFLHKMVRMIIGILTELGRDRIDEESIKLALELKGTIGHSALCAPAHGLYLKTVKYV